MNEILVGLSLDNSGWIIVTSPYLSSSAFMSKSHYTQYPALLWVFCTFANASMLTGWAKLVDIIPSKHQHIVIVKTGTCICLSTALPAWLQANLVKDTVLTVKQFYWDNPLACNPFRLKLGVIELLIETQIRVAWLDTSRPKRTHYLFERERRKRETVHVFYKGFLVLLPCCVCACMYVCRMTSPVHGQITRSK